MQIKVLQIGLGEKEYSGVSNWLYEHYRKIDHEVVHFDFLFCRENTMALKQNTDVLAQSEIFPLNISQKVKNKFLQYMFFYVELSRFLKNHKYDVVHVNTGSFPLQTIAAIISKKRHIKLHIAHSHSAHNKRSGKKQILLNLFAPLSRKIITKKSDELFACSEVAGEYLFGKKAKYRLLPNGIDLERYKFNSNVRKEIRLVENISDEKIIYCFVGRLAESKNLLFLVDVFSELYKRNSNSILWIIGDGEMHESIEERVRNYNLGDFVKLWGERNDVENLLQAADAFIFTSFFEGLSMVAIEAQASGLPVFASDSISPEHRVTDSIFFYPLDKSKESWADWIETIMLKKECREDTSEMIAEAGYDIERTAKWLEEFYLKKVVN